jgi:hypothetical protein
MEHWNQNKDIHNLCGKPEFYHQKITTYEIMKAIKYYNNPKLSANWKVYNLRVLLKIPKDYPQEKNKSS